MAIYGVRQYGEFGKMVSMTIRKAWQYGEYYNMESTAKEVWQYRKKGNTEIRQCNLELFEKYGKWSIRQYGYMEA
jgi:hypothetical protein